MGHLHQLSEGGHRAVRGPPTRHAELPFRRAAGLPGHRHNQPGRTVPPRDRASGWLLRRPAGPHRADVLSITDDSGRRRLDDPDDYVRLVIAAAVGRSDVLVIPVLVGPTSMPAAANLPKPLAPLAECNALLLTDEYWDDQVAHLTRALEKCSDPSRAQRPGSPCLTLRLLQGPNAKSNRDEASFCVIGARTHAGRPGGWPTPWSAASETGPCLWMCVDRLSG